MWQLLPLILNGTPLMFCLPNDTTLASCGLASFENTLAIWDIYFCPKTQIPLLHRINVTTSGLNIIWRSAYGKPSQRHHPRPTWTCQLREHSRHLRHAFLHKITYFCTGYLRQLLALILNGTPLMFYLPNDTTPASCGLAIFENTLAIWYMYFAQIHKFHFCTG